MNLTNLIELNVVSEFYISFSYLGDSARFFLTEMFLDKRLKQQKCPVITFDVESLVTRHLHHQNLAMTLPKN